MPGKPTYEELEQRVDELETEHKRIGELIPKGDSRYRTLFELANDAIFIMRDYRFVECNKMAIKIFGCEKQKDILDFSPWDFSPPNQPDGSTSKTKAIELMNTALMGNPQRFYWKHTRSDGIEFDADISLNLLEAEGSKSLQAIVRDITQNKRIEEELKKKTHDLGERIKELNCLYHISNLVQRSDLSLEEVLYSIVNLIPSTWQYPEITCARLILKGGEYQTDNFRETEWKLFSDILVYGEKTGGLEICYLEERPKIEKDPFFDEERNLLNAIAKRIGRIIERKQAEKALRESEEKFRTFSDHSPNMIFINNGGRVVYTNKRCEEFTGYSRDEFYSPDFNFLMLIAPEHRELVKKNYNHHIQGEEVEPYEYSILAKDGQRIDVIITTRIIDYEGGKAILGVATDITERKQADEDRKKMQHQLANALEFAHLGPWEYDEANNLFTFNDYFYKIYRTTADQVGGYNMSSAEYFRRFVPSDEIPIVKEQIQEAIEKYDPNNIPQFEHRSVYADGTIGYITVRFFIIKDETGRIIKHYGVNQDVTARKKAEDRLRESEEKLTRSRKMESLGLLAGGVAHDLNNVLAGIVSYPELLLLELPEDSKFRQPIQTIQESGNRAVAIVQDLLTVARGVASARETLNINNIIKEYLNSPEFKKLVKFHPAISVKTDLDADLMNINASSVHIRKVIMNLVSNSSEAIKTTGNVIISTMNRYVDRPKKGYEDISIGEYAVLSVSDDGSGIPPNHLERIFEPFFTKKTMGTSGTGLGLAVVWNIVQDHGGYVDVSSGKNGTTFEIYFPITRDEIQLRVSSTSIDDYKGKGETLLVIDDMESQREITCNMLSVLGYKPKAVSGGEEAVEYLKGHSVDLLLLDMIMDPGMSGRETFERIIRIRPGQKAIIVSGFSETDEVKAIQKLGAGRYLKKPLTLQRLGLAIKEELKES